MHSTPGQIQQETPPCEEHVPLWFCEHEYVPSLQRAVGFPHAAVAGAFEQVIESAGGGDGGAGGAGAGAIERIRKSILVSADSVRPRSPGL